ESAEKKETAPLSADENRRGLSPFSESSEKKGTVPFSAASQPTGELQYINVDKLDGIDRQFLIERHLISREHADSHGARGVAIDGREQISLMINEEDHLRIQCMHSGLDLQGAWEQINHIDDLIEQRVTYAYHPRLGYLTACPTNVGTGLRVSVMLHLPA